MRTLSPALPALAVSLAPALALALVLAACGRPGSAPPPNMSETPPTTKDPGAVTDERPLQPSPPPRPENGTGDGSATEAGKPDGAPCAAGPQCASGICEGEGCTDDRLGTCAPRSRPCTKDLRQYCGCDGKTFGASGTCPGRRFTARASCGS